ncbi:hypothetical protein D3C78_1745470 [compost metagenome]
MAANHQQVGAHAQAGLEDDRLDRAAADQHPRPAAGLGGQLLRLLVEQALGPLPMLGDEVLRRLVIDHMHQGPVATALPFDQAGSTLHGVCRTLGKVGRHQ